MVIIRLIPPEFMQYNIMSAVVIPRKVKALVRLMKKAGITPAVIEKHVQGAEQEHFLIRQTVLDSNRMLDEWERKYLYHVYMTSGKL